MKSLTREKIYLCNFNGNYLKTLLSLFIDFAWRDHRNSAVFSMSRVSYSGGVCSFKASGRETKKMGTCEVKLWLTCWGCRHIFPNLIMDTLYWHRVSGARADGRGEERGNLKKIEVAEGNLFSLTFFKQRMTSSSANSIFFKHKRFDKFECEIWRASKAQKWMDMDM